MPDPLMGRYASVKIATVLVENLGRWRLTLSGAEIDVSAFGDSWEKKMPGMQGWTANLEGMYDPADTDGQAILIAAKTAATKLKTLRLYIDSTSYWTIASDEDTVYGCYIRSVDISHDKAGVAQVTMEVLGYGKIKLA
jgi:hypothetical protein